MGYGSRNKQGAFPFSFFSSTSECKNLPRNLYFLRRSQRGVADVAGVTEVTIRNRYKDSQKN